VVTSDPKLRILVLSTSYPLRPASSSGVFVRRLVDALTPHARMTVLCPSDAAAEAVDSSAVSLHAFRYGPRRWQRLAQEPGGVLPAIKAQPALLVLLPVFLLSLSWSLLRLSRRADVIHANWAICGAIAAALRPLHGRPIVLTLRGDDVTVAERSGVHRRLLRLAVSRADAVVCVAESMAQNLRTSIPSCAAKVTVALNGVGSEFSPRGDAPERRRRVIFVGSLIPRKGVDVLLRAFSRLRRADLALRIVGDGPERARLEALTSDLGIRQQVEFIGQIAPDEVAAHLATHGTFVLPSYSEGRPNVLLEAMAAGAAVVATRIPGIVETAMHGEHAWLFDAGDADALAVALADVLSRPQEVERRSEAARRHVEACGWTWAATAQIYAELFARVGMAS
jgi:glycosyltransferase involved in cell wall biosynthesis